MHRLFSLSGLTLAGLSLLGAGRSLGQQVEQRPAAFTVTTDVVAPNPGRYTATVSEGPVNRWVSAGYEPIYFRTKLHLEADSPNELIVSRHDIDGYNTYRSGLWDGAKVRVYRARNDKLVLVREDVIAEHDASGWLSIEGFGGKLIAPDVTQVQFTLPGWWRESADQWVTVVATSKRGESEPAEAAHFVVPETVKGKVTPESAKTVPLPKDAPDATDPDLAAPTNVRVTVDPKTRIFTLSWDPTRSPDLIGYQIRISDYAPQDQKGFHLRLKQTPTDPSQHLKAGDIVFLEKERTTLPRSEIYTNRMLGTGKASLTGAFPFDEHEGRGHWELVPHPQPLPEDFNDAGKTCLFIESTDNKPIEIKGGRFGHLEQSYYKVLEPDKRYVVEFWARQEGLADPTATFGFNQVRYRRENAVNTTFQITGEWKKHSAELKVPFILDKQTSVGEMVLSFKGPGKIWLDNFRVYEAGTPFMSFFEPDNQELLNARLEALRTHALIKTDFGYSMEMLTNAAGVTGFQGGRPLSAHTLDSLLRICKAAQTNPWIQIEMAMRDDEWLGFIEYMAAPYDPAVDSQQTKPWAYKRFRQGHPKPWIDDFSNIYFEISNETWNPLFAPYSFLGRTMPDEATGKKHPAGEIYGMLQEHVLQVMKTSPYWTADLDAKFQPVLGGWAIQTTDSGYGQQAAAMSPSSRHMTIAGYNGGWDEKERPVEPTDEFRFQALVQPVQVAIPAADKLAAWRDAFNQKFDRHIKLGTYEAGPGYNLNGLNGVKMTPAQVEAESQVMKSLTGGTATLDAFLARGLRGFVLQNFFTFSRNRYYWVSHAPMTSGGQAYPCWSLLALYDREGTGDFLKVDAQSTPTADLKAASRNRRKPLDDAPLVACYATRDGNRVNVFVLSRRIDGTTPVTLNLPFKSAGKITLHKMAGDPAANNLDAENVKLETADVPATALKDGVFTIEGGLTPAATHLYVFEQTDLPKQ